MRPADLPNPERHPHGTRARYVGARCRCAECRAANTASEVARRKARREGDWNGNVEPGPVLEHLRALSRQGVGYKSVAAAASVATATLFDLISGRSRQLRALTARRVLAVDVGAMADGAIVSGAPTWRLIRRMLAAGLTRGEIAQRLGCKTPALQLRRRVLASTALRVRKLYDQVQAELAVEREAARICDDCGFSHAPEDRLPVLRRMLPCTAEDLREAHPCWWGRSAELDPSKDRVLYRDLHALHAVRVLGSWELPARRPAANSEAMEASA